MKGLAGSTAAGAASALGVAASAERCMNAVLSENTAKASRAGMITSRFINSSSL